MTWLIISIILLFVGWYFLSGANKKTLLEARISTSNAQNYKVAFSVLEPDLVPNEYIRLILGFVTKMLHIIDPNDPNQTSVKQEILLSIKKLSDSELNHDTNVAIVCDQHIHSSSGEPSSRDKKIVATLYFLNPMERFVNTSIPTRWYEYQFLHSWIALIQATLPKLNEKQLNHLHHSLKVMREMYFEENIDFSKMESMAYVQNRSFSDGAHEAIINK